jgi:hypothetical protein
MPRNTKAPLIWGVGKSLGRHLTSFRTAQVYQRYKQMIFPALLEPPNVLPNDKQKIVELLKKHWPNINQDLPDFIKQKSRGKTNGRLRLTDPCGVSTSADVQTTIDLIIIT